MNTVKILAGLENEERNEKLSPTIGHPKLPGILSIALGADRFRSKKAKDIKNKKSATSVNIPIIFTRCSKISVMVDKFSTNISICVAYYYIVRILQVISICVAYYYIVRILQVLGDVLTTGWMMITMMRFRILTRFGWLF